MKQLCIHQSDSFAVVSYGNGLAYSFDNKLNGTSVFVSGDDAEQFRKDLESCMELHSYSDEDAMWCLWHGFEYCLAARPVEQEEA